MSRVTQVAVYLAARWDLDKGKAHDLPVYRQLLKFYGLSPIALFNTMLLLNMSVLFLGATIDETPEKFMKGVKGKVPQQLVLKAIVDALGDPRFVECIEGFLESANAHWAN